MWTNVGVDYTFGSTARSAPPVTETDLTGLTVNGVSLGNVKLQFTAPAASPSSTIRTARRG